MAEEADVDVFLQPDDSRDFALLVEGTKVYVNREFLGCWSPVLRLIFYPEGAPFEQPDGGMVMKDKRLDDFLAFLHAIVPSSKTFMVVHELNVSSLVAYADEYDVVQLREKCVKFMKTQLKKESVSGDTLVNYLRLASVYNLKQLQKQLVPKVAQLPVHEITEAHETLSVAVLAAVYQSRALSLETDGAVFACSFLGNGGCGKVCTISNGASSCCNRAVEVKGKSAGQANKQWAFTCSGCSLPCSLHRGLSLCCRRGVTVSPKPKGKKRPADIAADANAAKFSAELLDRIR